jgi:CheY-like chemotaxis protein
MFENARILVAAGNRSEADMLARFIREDFENVETSCHPETMVEDFERVEPHVLVLGFRTLEECERYYLGLYRLGDRVHGIEHRTVILCDRDGLKRVVALCRKEYFDDYVLFWPSVADPYRLNMSLIQALRRLSATGSGGPSITDFAAQARKLSELESVLESGLSQGGAHIERMSAAIRQVEAGAGSAIDAFTQRILRGEQYDVVEVKNPEAFSAEFSRLREESIARPLSEVSALIKPVQDWVGDLNRGVAPHLETTRSLGRLAEKIKPKILFVDDDEFQHRLVGRLLDEADVELHCAPSGTDALKTLRTLRPDLILMDFNLPDISGIDLTRRIKAAAAFENVPVVMVTGSSAKKVVVASVEAGASDFVLKPFDRIRLVNRIEKHLGRRRKLLAADAAQSSPPASPARSDSIHDSAAEASVRQSPASSAVVGPGSDPPSST